MQNILHHKSLALGFLYQRFIDMYVSSRIFWSEKAYKWDNIVETICYKVVDDLKISRKCVDMNIRIIKILCKVLMSTQMAGTLSRRTVNMSYSQPSHFWYSLEILMNVWESQFTPRKYELLYGWFLLYYIFRIFTLCCNIS